MATVTSPRIVRGPLRHRCAEPTCTVTSEARLFRCTACNLVRYCSREHQFYHHPEHNSLCAKAKKLRADKCAGEQALQPTWGEPWGDHQWRSQAGRTSTDCLRDWVSFTKSLSTLDSVQDAYDTVRELLRLLNASLLYDYRQWETITMLVLMLRLDMDQQCFEAAKSWKGWVGDRKYHYPVESGPIFDSIPLDLGDDWTPVEPMMALLMLKLKLLVDIRNLKIAKKLMPNTPLPPELWENVEKAVLRSPTSRQLVKKSYEEMVIMEMKVLRNVQELGKTVTLRCSMLENSIRMAYGYEPMPELVEPVVEVLRDTEGIMEMLQSASRCRGIKQAILVSYGRGINDNMPYPLNVPHPGEFFMGFIFKSLWNYLDWAVQDYSYLGERDERYSARMHMSRETAERRDMEYRCEMRMVKLRKEFNETWGLSGDE